MDFELDYPVQWDGKEVSKITFRRPKGKEIKRIKGTTLGDLMQLAPVISDYSESFYDDLDAADYVAISEVISDFLERGRKTGKN